MSTTIQPYYEQEFARMSALMDVGCNVTTNIHGFSYADLAEMMSNGELDELKRTTIDGGETYHLVGKVNVGRIAFTLFSESQGDAEAS